MENRFDLQINMDNEAFSDGYHIQELQRILKRVSERLEDGFDSGVIMDSNGNKVGKFYMDFETEKEIE